MGLLMKREGLDGVNGRGGLTLRSGCSWFQGKGTGKDLPVYSLGAVLPREALPLNA